MSKVLSRRQARWAEILASYDVVIQPLEGNKNHPDGPSRRPDHEESYERPPAPLLATLAATTVSPFHDLLPATNAADDTDPLLTDMKSEISYPCIPNEQDRSTDKEADMQWKVIPGALTFEVRIYVPITLCNQVISLFHNNPESGHLGALRTGELVSTVFYWLGLETTVWKYVAGGHVCHRFKVPRHACY